MKVEYMYHETSPRVVETFTFIAQTDNDRAFLTMLVGHINKGEHINIIFGEFEQKITSDMGNKS